MKSKFLLICLALAGCSLFTAPQLTVAEKYSKLNIGMTYQEFVNIMGGEGTVSTTAETPAGTTLYVWENTDGSRIEGEFRDGKAISKATVAK